MAFEPEKVHDIPPYMLNERNQTFRAVSREDYDALLDLYRAECVKPPVQFICPFCPDRNDLQNYAAFKLHLEDKHGSN